MKHTFNPRVLGRSAALQSRNRQWVLGHAATEDHRGGGTGSRVRGVLPSCARVSAFTLIELLVVIAIIAVVAGLVVALAPGANQKKVISRAKTELQSLITAIDSYQAKKGFYPPDNPQDPAQPPLFYELTGTIKTNINNEIWFMTVNGQERIRQTDVKQFFKIDGFLNASTSQDEVQNFMQSLRPSQFQEISANPDVELLVAPRKKPGQKINAVYYDASSANRHNPESYDLWMEIVVGGRTNIIGNW